MRLENKQHIKEIVMRPKAICFCPLGNDWYTNEFEITIQPNDYFPDYCDMETFLNEEIRGKSLIIEDAVDKVWQYINTYAPAFIEVRSIVDDVASHSPVVVIK